MRAAARIGWRLLLNSRRLDLIGPVLAAVAVTVSVAILLLTLGVNTGLQGRAERASWRHPAKVDAGSATALQAVATDFVDGVPVVLVDLAAIKPAAPIPPGMGAFPQPGEVWVSPALAALLHNTPADELSDRILDGSAAPTGTLGSAALTYTNELVAVVGRDADDPAMTVNRRPDPRRDGDMVTATPIAGFTESIIDFSPEALYVGLGRVAAVLVAVPLLVLGAAAARLSVARRDQRLAALRLIGASPTQIVTVTALEAVAAAAVGVVAGTGIYLAILPVAAQLSVGGGGFRPSELWIGGLPLLAVAVAIPLLVGGSAVVGLRQLIVSPLGVARRHTPAPLKAVRLLVFGGVLLGYARVVTGADVALTSVLVALAAAFLALALIGPWALSLLGRLVGARATKPVTLLAGRRLADDPRSAWRTVGGITLAAFVAGFLAPYSVGDTSTDGTTQQLMITVPSTAVDSTVSEVSYRLRGAGVAATVSTRFDPILGTKPDRLVVVASIDNPTQVDQARTAVHDLSPGQPAVTDADVGWRDRQFSADYRTVGLLVLAASFAIAAASAAIVTAATVVDQRRTIQQLYLAGTPLNVLYRAQTAQLFLPLLVTGGGALVVGVLCAAPYTWLSGAPLNFSGLAVLMACVAAGALAMFVATAAARPLVRALCVKPILSAVD